MSLPLPILPPDSLFESVAQIEALSEDDFGIFLHRVTGPRSFELKKQEVDLLQSSLSASNFQVTYALATLSFIYQHLKSAQSSAQEIEKWLIAFIEDGTRRDEWQGDKSVLLRRIKDVLFSSEVHEVYSKRKELRAGFLPTATAFRTFVDLRSDFQRTGEQIVGLNGLLPVIQMRVVTNSRNPQEREFVFQIDPEDLEKLQKVIEQAKSKLSYLSESLVTNSSVVRL